MNPQAIMAAVPWLRRIWKLTPPQLRVPLLLIVAAVGIVQFVQGRKPSDGPTSTSSAAPAGSTPAGTADGPLFP